MSQAMSNALSQELVELFDMKKAKLRYEKHIAHEANEAQKDITLLTLMFRDGIPDIELAISEREKIRWDSRSQQLIYLNDGTASMIEVTSRETRVKIRPFLAEMVKKAKKLYV